MAVTRLTPAGHPGAAISAEEAQHTGLFTALSVLGIPGPRRSFAAKAPAGGRITALSVLGIPGGIRVFLDKAPFVPPEPEPPPAIRSTAGGAGVAVMAGRYIEPRPRPEPWRDDEDFLDLLALTLPIIME
jgi:hypothetical protein